MDIDKWFIRFPINDRILNEVLSSIRYPLLEERDQECGIKVACILAGFGLDSESIARCIGVIYSRKTDNIRFESWLIQLSKQELDAQNLFKVFTARQFNRVGYLLRWIKNNGYNFSIAPVPINTKDIIENKKTEEDE